jgi:hypothetical protein
MTDITQLREAQIARILDGHGEASPPQRRAAFENAGFEPPLSTLVDKVAKQSHRVTDQDVAAVRATGLSENQVFELVVCAAIGQANRQYEAAMAALDVATRGE